MHSIVVVCLLHLGLVWGVSRAAVVSRGENFTVVSHGENFTVVTSVVMSSVVGTEVESDNYGEKFTLEDYLDKSFRPKSLETTWLPGKSGWLSGWLAV